MLATCATGFAQVAERPADAWAELNAQVQQAYRDAQYQRGAELGAEALALAEQRFGSQDTRTIMSANNLALNYDALGRLDAAEPLFRRALASHERVYGPDHPLTLVSLTNLAGLYQLRGRFDEAEVMLRHVVDARVRQFGEGGADAVRARHNLESLLRARAAASVRLFAVEPVAETPDPSLAALAVVDLSGIVFAGDGAPARFRGMTSILPIASRSNRSGGEHEAGFAGYRPKPPASAGALPRSPDVPLHSVDSAAPVPVLIVDPVAFSFGDEEGAEGRPRP
ncbi:tetratricopeptide repeat protein [Sphingomonas colocasiae]|uniref:Tetratricopeptide repeat protein n=1 Tax=Sphingomonas colocasiae TaxID=1848973 RepID=A0ABS7PWB9_9SPHN|nr:tetratricopeptide repeat protein [Sphingomonas colocasiae]MBY8825655.1 tetratricopeptide repeat protein [Sphingomonas colocasiae]